MGMNRESTGVRGLKIRSGKWVIDKVYKGVHIYETLDLVETMSVDDAQAVLGQRITDITAGKYFPERGSGSLTVTDALEYLWEKRLKFKSYSATVKPLLAALDRSLGRKLVNDLSHSDMDSYKRDRAQEKKRNRVKGMVGPRQIQKELSHLSMALNLLVDDRMMLMNPIRKCIGVPQEEKDKVILDSGMEDGPEWNSLYEAMCPSGRAIILTIYETGMRPVEAFNFRWSWLQEAGEDRYVILVPARFSVDGVKVFREKTLNGHRVPVPAKLLATLKRLGIRNDNTLVFPAPRLNGPRKDIEQAFTNALTRADLTGRGYSPYALRRTRLTIWDQIDSVASMYAAGHVFRDVHHRHYVEIPNERIFRLVRLEYRPALRLAVSA